MDKNYYFALIIEDKIPNDLEYILTLKKVSEQIGQINNMNWFEVISEDGMINLFDELLVPLGCKRFHNDRKGHMFYITTGMTRYYIRLFDRSNFNENK